MAICGLVITVSERPDARGLALARLAEIEGLLLGEASGQRIPAVLERGGRHEIERLWQQLGTLPGVLHLDLAYAHYGDSAGETQGGERR